MLSVFEMMQEGKHRGYFLFIFLLIFSWFGSKQERCVFISAGVLEVWMNTPNERALER